MPFIDKLGKAFKSNGKVFVDSGKEIKKKEMMKRIKSPLRFYKY